MRCVFLVTALPHSGEGPGRAVKALGAGTAHLHGWRPGAQAGAAGWMGGPGWGPGPQTPPLPLGGHLRLSWPHPAGTAQPRGQKDREPRGSPGHKQGRPALQAELCSPDKLKS